MEEDFSVEKVGSCVVIRMELGENRLNPNFVRAMNKALDTAESYDDAKCLVTISKGKYYSLGLDLDLFASMRVEEVSAVLSDIHKLLSRILTFPLVTVAAINGHAFAGGLFLAIAHDYRVMRSERGWMCLPEIRLKLTFTPGLMELSRARLPQAEHHKAVVLGKRYTAEEAKAVGIVNEVFPLSQLESSAIEAGSRLAGEEGLDRKTLAAIKHDLYRDTCRALTGPIHFVSKL